jgi:hypothetical protein
MREVERKDKEKDEQPEIPDVSGGQGYIDGCIPIGPEFPDGDYPPLPGSPIPPRDRTRGWPTIEP